MASSTPPFDPSGTRYDQKTYTGRLAHFREMVSPSTLLVGDAELAARVDLLERHARGAAPEASDADLWDAKRIKDAIIHPTTGEKMFMPGRMSAFVPQHGRSVPGSAELGCCVSSGLAWRLWAAQTHRARGQATGHPATALGTRASRRFHRRSPFRCR